MPVLSLIARPGALETALVDDLCRSLGGEAPRWLSAGEAAQFALPARPHGFDALRASLAGRIDVNIVADQRRARLLLADMDSTMIRQECIDELAEEAGVGDAVRDITARAMEGALDFESALTARVALLKDLPETVIGDVLTRRITLMPGGPVLLATMRRDGAFAALVSGGFTAFSSRVAAALGFDEHRANTLEIADARLTGRVRPPILGRDAKVEALDTLTERLGIGAGEVIAVGDGANDLGMLGAAGMGVALHAKAAVAAACDLRVNHGDLTALLYLQGYAKAQFAPAPDVTL